MTTTSLSASGSAVDGVREGAGSGGEGVHEQVEASGDVGVALFGGPFPVVNAVGVALDLVEPGPLVVGVHLVECVVHEVRVSPMSAWAVLCDLWCGLPRQHRDVLAAAITVGCMFFLVLGACLR